MAIFNSYVKLPEGKCCTIYGSTMDPMGKKSGDVIVDSLTDSSYSSCAHHHGIITTPHQIHLQHPAATLLLFKIAAAPKILAFGIPQLRRTLRITTFLQECRLPTS